MTNQQILERAIQKPQLTNYAITKLREICPDVVGVTVFTNYPGIAGWVVQVRYKGDRMAAFSVDQGEETQEEMKAKVEASITKHLRKYLEENM